MIRTDRKRLAIYGGPRHGALYGVYTLLEEYFGCRKYTAEPVVVPHTAKLRIGVPLDDEQIPQITSRYTYTMPYDSLYLDWHKLNHELDCRISEFGLFVHTFNTLLPPENTTPSTPNTMRWSKAGGSPRNPACRTRRCSKSSATNSRGGSRRTPKRNTGRSARTTTTATVPVPNVPK